MKWKPFLAGAVRAKWHFRRSWLTLLSRRGACVRRQLSHGTHPLKASRRAVPPRLANA